MQWVYDDGGRRASGYKGHTGDCVCRAIAIGAQRPYQEVYDLINEYSKEEHKSSRKKSNARTGVRPATIRKIMDHYGFVWMPTMQIGQGCRVHMKADELPAGRIICRLSKHLVAVVDGVIHDTYDCSRDESRCVYGYYIKKDH